MSSSLISWFRRQSALIFSEQLAILRGKSAKMSKSHLFEHLAITAGLQERVAYGGSRVVLMTV
jgi:hypothetical protein